MPCVGSYGNVSYHELSLFRLAHNYIQEIYNWMFKKKIEFKYF